MINTTQNCSIFLLEKKNTSILLFKFDFYQLFIIYQFIIESIIINKVEAFV